MIACNLSIKCPVCGNPVPAFLYGGSEEPKPHYRHVSSCKTIAEFLSNYKLDVQQLVAEYHRLGSLLEFQKTYPFKKSHLFYYRMFSRLHIDVSVKFSANHSNTKQKTTATNISRHGVKHNFCKESPSRKTWEKRLLEEEGITNVFQREDVKIKSLNTLLAKYGEEHVTATRAVSRGRNVISSVARCVASLLREEGIPFKFEKKLRCSGYRYFAYDIIILGTKKLIEVNGDYWHGNPRLYQAEDIILRGSSKEVRVGDKWDYDAKKLAHARNMGYNVEVVWEYDLKNDFDSTRERLIAYAKSKD